MGKKILVIGSGGREHALCWKLKQSPDISGLYCAPGNGGIAEVAACLALASHSDILAFCQKEHIDLVVIGPEQPLVEGLADSLRAAGTAVFGPGALGAQLEGSKAFTKTLCTKYNIPTAAYGEFTDAAKAKAYVEKQTLPLVVKADGLAAGKGVIIAETKAQAFEAIDSMFAGAFGAAGEKVVIEEFMEGEEVSFFALCDGKTAIPFGYAQDHKRAYDGDKGPNTGGMGTYAPTPVMTAELEKTVMETIIQPTLKGLQAEQIPFQGVLFAGLMLTKEGPKLLEYNTRFGDPETQVLMCRLDGDLLPLLEAVAHGTLTGHKVNMTDSAAVCVVMAAEGYPGAYQKGSEIKNIALANAVQNAHVFHAGTESKDGKVIATGGRVLGITAIGSNFHEARAAAYKAVDAIDWPKGFCRRDIGWRGMQKT